MQRLCKPRAEHQACLNVMPRCSQSYAKIVQTESRTSSLFECFAEVQPILCKDNEFNSILHYHWAKCFQIQQIKDIDTVTERIVFVASHTILLSQIISV